MRRIKLFALLVVVGFTTCFGQQNDAVKKINDSTVLTSDSVALYMKVAGKGSPCIFVHGGPGAWSLSFEALGGDVLEKHLTMYYFDQRGSGRSASPGNNDYSLERMIKDIEEIRAFTGSEKVFLIGHSFGGILVHSYAMKYPDHVRGLILLNATLYLNNSLVNQVEYINQLLGENIPVNDGDSLMKQFSAARALLRDRQLEYKMLSDNKAAIEKLDSLDNSMPRNYSFAQNAFSTPVYSRDFTQETANTNVPVLVISGAQDHSIGPNHYKLFRYPRQKTVVIQGGHFLYYEKNKEFANAVFRFVR